MDANEQYQQDRAQSLRDRDEWVKNGRRYEIRYHIGMAINIAQCLALAYLVFKVF